MTADRKSIIAYGREMIAKHRAAALAALPGQDSHHRAHIAALEVFIGDIEAELDVADVQEGAENNEPRPTIRTDDASPSTGPRSHHGRGSRR